jgi:glycosyltransferase involved in cell wall biosynthesis
MTILFDLSAAQPIRKNDFHGAGEYAKVVFFKLCEKISNSVILEVLYNPEKFIDDMIINACEEYDIVRHHCVNNAQINILLKTNSYDVFYTALPYSYQDLQIPSRTKFIYTVHGLRSLEYPWDSYILKYKKAVIKTVIKKIISLFFPKSWNNYLVRKSKKDFAELFSLTKNQLIITVSNHTKHSINYFFSDIKLPPIETLYSPEKSIRLESCTESAVLEKYSLKAQNYILLIGGDRHEKGAYRACKALHTLFLTNTNDVLNSINNIILGVSNKKVFEKMTNNSKKFIFSGYVPASELEALYKNAHLFIYPTLNEGFGYPPLEAMKYGTLCACSANSAITEICGDSVLYFNPYDDVEMGIRVLQSFDENIRREKIEKMKTRYALIRERQDRDLNTLVELISSPPDRG